MGFLFNLDLLGYGIMALSTFFIGCFIMPMTGMFADSDGSASIGGVIALEFWCLYFIPIGILLYLHFKNNKS